MKFISKGIFAGLLAIASSATFAAWGAIVVVDWQGLEADDVGYAQHYDAPTEAEASSQAMSACRNMQVAEGNKASECRLVVTFQKCGAYAISKNNFGVGSASLLSIAEKQALQQCGNKSCKIVISGCNS